MENVLLWLTCIVAVVFIYLAVSWLNRIRKVELREEEKAGKRWQQARRALEERKRNRLGR